MKQELKDAAYEFVVRTVPAGAVSWWSQLTFTSFLTAALVVLQILYLLRKWTREETEWGMRLKRWKAQIFTKPGDLQ